MLLYTVHISWDRDSRVCLLVVSSYVAVPLSLDHVIVMCLLHALIWIVFFYS